MEHDAKRQQWLLTYNAALGGLLAYRDRDRDMDMIESRACKCANRAHEAQFEFTGRSLAPKASE